jgi:hypothetical protein
VGWNIRKRSVARQDATSLGSHKPLARSHGLVIEELGDELLVYDQLSDRAHCLGAKASTVWRACDGEKTVSALTAKTGLDAELVAQALVELRECKMLDGLPAGAGMTRRDMTVRVAKLGAAAASVPLIVSVAAPVPAAAITPTPALCAEYNANSCAACCNIIGCCCCCEGGGGTTGPSCKLCYPTSTCADFICPSATPPQYDSHCSCKGGEFEAGTVDCEDVIQKGQIGSCGCTYTG